MTGFESFVGVNPWTALFTFCNMLITFAVLKKFLFKPVKKMIDDRQQEIDTMYADAKAEYLALPAEKRTTTQLAKMAKGYLSRANALEKECDGKMDEVIRAMETLIRDNNGDLTLVDTVVYTYANEKSLKKSWYMTKLEQKGLL